MDICKLDRNVVTKAFLPLMRSYEFSRCENVVAVFDETFGANSIACGARHRWD